jgi:peptidoglycan-associated lipoprotein
MKLFKLAVLSSLVMLTACSGPMTKEGSETGEVAVEDRTTEYPGSNDGKAMSDAETTVIVGEGAYQGDPLDDPNSLLANRTVYFEFDSSAIRADDQAILVKHAEYLADNPNKTVRLEGHADERGSREYNLALGERRALAVRQVLMLQGATVSQFEVTSYGEERPAVEGHSEAAWQQNRRVELKYK